jgi:hypothetical protein
VDRFAFFFAFYGLILGLAVAELLSGFAGMVRAHALKKLEARTALLALLIFLMICTTWIDAWSELRSLDLVFADLWAPILLATFYYLAAAVVFPHEREQYAHLSAYFAARKRFVVGLLWATTILECYASLGYFEDAFERHRTFFWAFLVPYNLASTIGFLALLLVRGRRPVMALLGFEILLTLVPYWQSGLFYRLVTRLFGA